MKTPTPYQQRGGAKSAYPRAIGCASTVLALLLSSACSDRAVTDRALDTAVAAAGAATANDSDDVSNDDINDDEDTTDADTVDDSTELSDGPSYRISLRNLTAGQPLAPPAVVLHEGSWSAFSTAHAASEAIEHLAESGSAQALLDDASNASDAWAQAVGSAVIAPGGTQSLILSIDEAQSARAKISVLSMLVNSNDAFGAINGHSLASLGVGESYHLDALSYDSGTEANTESADTIPGPAAGASGAAEGFNASRDDVRDAVYVHSGIVSADDGLANSALTGLHRWENPVFSVTVERLQ